MANRPTANDESSPDFFSRVEAIVQAALDAPPGERKRIIEEQCAGDQELRRAVQRLVEIPDTNVETFLDGTPLTHFAVETPTVDSGKRGNTPRRIGRYEIIRRIGEGGMGIVFEARQDHPHRRVALKVIRGGMPSENHLRRFRLEAEVLGQLQHAGIAHVYEAGVAELVLPDGVPSQQPYFAMEFIDGPPLTEYIRSRSCDLKQKLELFVGVCDAVEHAHSKGVIHRDLKPGNILVAGDGQPKILDFGIARLTTTDAQLTTLRTDVGQLIGTLPYMSPEQVDGTGVALDVRSDVYALGVLLYELLIGRLPHELRNRSIPDAIRIIRDDEPTRLSSVDTKYRGDLESIAAKALEKNRDHRYSSAAALAADIRHFLRDEPVAARPVSTFYQLRKFARRNRAIVIGAAATFIVLIAGLIGVGFFASREYSQRLRADQQAAEAHRLAYRASLAAAAGALHDQDAASANHNLESAPPALRGWEWDYYHFLANQPQCTFDVRRAPMAHPFAASSDASMIAVGYADGKVRIIDGSAARVVRELACVIPGARITIGMSRDGATVFIITPENDAVAMDISSGREKWKIGDANCLGTFALDSAELYVAKKSEPKVQIVDAVSGNVKNSFKVPLTEITQITQSPDKTLLGASFASKTVVLESSSAQFLHRFDAWQWTFTPDSQRIAISGRAAHMIDSRTGRHISDLSRNIVSSESILFQAIDGIMATSESGASVCLREPHTTTIINQLGIPTGIRDFAFAADFRSLLTLSREGILCRWDSDLTPAPFQLRPSRQEDCIAAVVSPQGCMIAVGGWGLISLYDTSTGELKWRRPVSRRYVTSVGFSEDGQYLAAPGQSGSLIILNVQSGNRIHDIDLHVTSLVTKLVFHSPTSVLVGCNNGAILETTFSLEDNSTPLAATNVRRIADDLEIQCMSRSSDGRWVAVSLSPSGGKTQSANRVNVFDTATWTSTQTIESDGSVVRALVFLNGSRELALGGDDKIVRLYSLSDRKLLGRLMGASATICQLAIHPYGARLAAACVDGSIHLWNMQTQDEVATLTGTIDEIHAMRFSPDGTTLLASTATTPMILYESRKPQAGHAARRRALCGRAIAAPLLEKLEFAEDVIRSLENDKDIALDTRTAAIAFVRAGGDHPNWMNSDSWGICRTPSHGRDEYAVAIRKAKIAVATFPDDYGVLNTLGVAQLRHGDLDEALKTLMNCDQLFRKSRGYSHPVDLLSMSMIYAMKGQSTLAAQLISKARETMKTTAAIAGEESQSFLKEAEDVARSSKSAPSS
jgi:WD40 repeat protein/predicted Ser/Thr protein kinase